MKTSLLLSLMAILLLQTSPTPRHPNYVLDRTPAQGKRWLSWSPDERQRFILGYLWAYHSGFSAACRDYFEISQQKSIGGKTDDLLQECKLQELQYSKDITYYERSITDYYKEFTDDTDLPLAWIIQAFSDSEQKTPADIHAAWSHGHAHP
jgi:hypothetical protein